MVAVAREEREDVKMWLGKIFRSRTGICFAGTVMIGWCVILADTTSFVYLLTW